MPKFIVDINLDGYENKDEEAKACLVFILEQLNTTASSVSATLVPEPKPRCKHEHIIPDKDCGSAVCADCKAFVGGWYCPDSPDHECHYYTEAESGRVRLRGGLLVMPPKGHDPEEETDDDCIYCHAPEERK